MQTCSGPSQADCCADHLLGDPKSRSRAPKSFEPTSALWRFPARQNQASLAASPCWRCRCERRCALRSSACRGGAAWRQRRRGEGGRQGPAATLVRELLNGPNLCFEPLDVNLALSSASPCSHCAAAGAGCSGEARVATATATAPLAGPAANLAGSWGAFEAACRCPTPRSAATAAATAAPSAAARAPRQHGRPPALGRAHCDQPAVAARFGAAPAVQSCGRVV